MLVTLPCWLGRGCTCRSYGGIWGQAGNHLLLTGMEGFQFIKKTTNSTTVPVHAGYMPYLATGKATANGTKFLFHDRCCKAQLSMALRWLLLSYFFYRWQKDSGRLNDLPKISQLVSAWARIWTQEDWLQHILSLLLTYTASLNPVNAQRLTGTT